MSGPVRRVVVLGASLGGLEALRTVLEGLPGDLDAAVAVVQHRHKTSGAGLGELLGGATPLPIVEPDDGAPLVNGTIYVAPPDYHLLIERGHVSLSVDDPVRYARPSIDVLFESAVQAYGGSVVAALLTGSNDDGAAGLEAVHRAGGVTIVQDPTTAESAVAPRAALDRMTPTHVANIADVAGLLAAATRGVRIS